MHVKISFDREITDPIDISTVFLLIMLIILFYLFILFQLRKYISGFRLCEISSDRLMKKKKNTYSSFTEVYP